MDPRFIVIQRSRRNVPQLEHVEFWCWNLISTLEKKTNTPKTYFHLQGIEEHWGSFFANLNSWFIFGRISLLLLKTMMGRCQATLQQLHLRLDMLINPIKIKYPSFKYFPNLTFTNIGSFVVLVSSLVLVLKFTAASDWGSNMRIPLWNGFLNTCAHGKQRLAMYLHHLIQPSRTMK